MVQSVRYRYDAGFYDLDEKNADFQELGPIKRTSFIFKQLPTYTFFIPTMIEQFFWTEDLF